MGAGGSGGRAGCLLIPGLAVQFPAPPVYMIHHIEVSLSKTEPRVAALKLLDCSAHLEMLLIAHSIYQKYMKPILLFIIGRKVRKGLDWDYVTFSNSVQLPGRLLS